MLKQLKYTETYSDKDRNNHVKIIAGIIAVNIILAFIFPSEGARNNAGEWIEKGSGEWNRSIILTIGITFNIIGFFIGAFVSVFPYRNLPYSKKFLPTSLITIIILQGLIMILSIIPVVTKFFQM